MKNRPILSDEEVKIKLSLCNTCNGIVRAAAEHMMTTKSKNEFAKEVFKHNLSVKTISLLEYRKHELEWCDEGAEPELTTKTVLIEKI